MNHESATTDEQLNRAGQVQIQICDTLLVVFAKAQCLKSTGQNIDQTLVEFSAKRQCLKTSRQSNLLQTLIEATTKGQDL